MNYKIYISLITCLGLVPIKPVTAQSNSGTDSRLVDTKPNAAQSYLNLDGAQVFSTFKFSTKNGNQDIPSAVNSTYSYTTGSSFGLSYAHVKPNGLFALAGISMRKAGSSMIYKNVNFIWNMQYIDIKAGIGYQLNKWRLKPYAAVLPYYAHLLDAKQSNGSNNLNIINSVKNKDLGAFFSLGFKAAISPYFLIYSEYNYILGLQNIETTMDQYLYNRGFSIKLGIALRLTDFLTPEKKLANIPADPITDIAEKTSNEPLPSTIPVNEISVSADNNIASSVATKKEISEVKSSPTSIEENLEPVKNITLEPESNTHPPIIEPTVPDDQFENPEEDSESGKTFPVNATKNSPITKASDIEVAKSKNSNVSPENKSKKRNTVSNKMPAKIVFKIQIGSVSAPLGIHHPLLKNLSGKIEKKTGKDGMIRYYSGTFESYDEARSFLSSVKLKGGNEGAFVVAFKNGKQITVYEAKKLVEDK